METKSRYEVISDLEAKKRDLINHKANLDFEITSRENVVLSLERRKQDIAKDIKDYNIKHERKVLDLEREKEEFNFKVENTYDDVNRKIEDANREILTFKASIVAKKATFDELIKSIDDNLQRFGEIVKKN